jgi:high-affinity nickel-transport protein
VGPIFTGGVEALGLIGDRLGYEGSFWGFIGDMNDNLANFGFAVVGIFLASWLISTLIYRARGTIASRLEHDRAAGN